MVDSSAAGKLIDVNFTQIVIQSIRVVFINTNQVNDSIVAKLEPITRKRKWGTLSYLHT